MTQTSILAGGAPTPNMGATSPGGGEGGSSTYSAPAEPGVSTRLGMAVLADRPANTLQFTRSNAASTLTAHVTGLVVKLTPTGTLAPSTVKEQGAGIVTLTAAEWDSIAGTTGGLTIAKVYYLSDAAAGDITETKPTTSGHFVTQIGYAVSRTEMQLQISPPVLIP